MKRICDMLSEQRLQYSCRYQLIAESITMKQLSFHRVFMAKDNVFMCSIAEYIARDQIENK
jgi:hypothetical protein